MTQPVANCPNCGAKIVFQWPSSVQTVCTYCQSILVRSDVDVKKVGQVADLPPDSSPIQLNTEGVYKNKAFVVAGRILYEYEQGGWNEWHIVFPDGMSGWLSDAQLQYAVSFLVPGIALPAENQVFRGKQFNFANINFEVSTMTTAAYKGVQGELPFPFYGKTNMLFADLRTHDNDFATLDYSDQSSPMLFIGKTVPFEALQLQNLRQFEGWS